MICSDGKNVIMIRSTVVVAHPPKHFIMSGWVYEPIPQRVTACTAVVLIIVLGCDWCNVEPFLIGIASTRYSS